MSVDLPLTMNETNCKSDIVSQWFPTDVALTIMAPNQPEPLMKLPISIEQNSLQFYTNVLIDSAATLNYASQDFLTRNNMLGDCIRGPKIVVRIASEQRISTNKSFSPTHVSIGQKKFLGLNFTVLPHLKCVDFIFGLPAMKALNMSIQPSINSVFIGGVPLACESQPRRVSCLLADSSKMQKISAKAARNKHTESELFLVPLHFSEELESMKTDFGSKLDTQLKKLVTEFVDVTHEPQGLPPHRGTFDHKIRLTAYPKRQRRNRLSVPEYEELKRQCT
jgi:hypothetical protein